MADSADPRDHTGTTLASLASGYRVVCHCGWQSARFELRSDAEDVHALHVDLERGVPSDG